MPAIWCTQVPCRFSLPSDVLFFGLCVVILSLFLGVLESLHLYRLCIHLPRRDPNPVDLAPSNHSSIARPPLAESRSPRIVSKENDRRHG